MQFDDHHINTMFSGFRRFLGVLGLHDGSQDETEPLKGEKHKINTTQHKVGNTKSTQGEKHKNNLR